MWIKYMNFKILFIIIICSFTCFGQSEGALSRHFPGVAPNPAKAKIKTPGDNNAFPLNTNRSDIFNNPIVGRFNFFDSYVYSQGIDLQGHYDGVGEIPFAYFDYAIDLQYPNTATYQGFYNNVTYNAPTVSSSSSLVGFRNTAWQTSNANMHDIQGLTSQALITNGRAGSNINGAAFSVGVFSPATAQDVSGIAITSSIVNTTVRSYQGIWIQQPNLSGSTVLNHSSALRVDAGGVPVFMVSLDGTKINMSLSTPESSAEKCRTGEIRIDADYIYVCTSTNNLKRTALSAF